ncbi:MAG: Phenylalanine-tRNA ligase beta subunit, partial [Parcubacteria group bacterium GW2011_GWA2_46_7]
SFLEPESDMRIKVSGSEIGYMGLVDQGVRNTLDCSKKQVAFFELDYVALIGGRTFLAPQPFSPIPKYPPILRDISYFVPNGVNADSVQKMILGAASGKLRRHEFFDIYVKDGNKSMSSHLVFQSDETTLTDKEIDLEVGEITEVLQKKGFKIR